MALYAIDLKELSLALAEASESDDPKVLELAAALLKLASERLNPVPHIEPPERMAAV